MVSLHNHFPFSCFGPCYTHPVEPEVAQLQHYRQGCVNRLRRTCDRDYMTNITRDTAIWIVKDIVMENMERELKKIRLGND